MTNKVTFSEIVHPLSGEIIEYATIDRGNDEYTSMYKSEYDRRQAQQVEHLTPPAE